MGCQPEPLTPGPIAEGRTFAYSVLAQPHRQFLVSVLPLFFERAEANQRIAEIITPRGDITPRMPQGGPELSELGDASREASNRANGWSDAPELTKLVFVQTPQYFKHHELVDGQDHDPLAHSNAMFMDVSLPGMDGFGASKAAHSNHAGTPP